MYSTIDCFGFKVVYNFNLSTLFDLFPLPIYEKVILDGNRKPHVVKALHENVRRKIFKKMSNVHSKLIKGENGYFLTR